MMVHIKEILEEEGKEYATKRNGFWGERGGWVLGLNRRGRDQKGIQQCWTRPVAYARDSKDGIWKEEERITGECAKGGSWKFEGMLGCSCPRHSCDSTRVGKDFIEYSYFLGSAIS